jgi:hypothetical protein
VGKILWFEFLILLAAIIVPVFGAGAKVLSIHQPGTGPTGCVQM